MHLNTATGIADSMPIRLNLNPVLIETHRIVHTDGAPVFERKHHIQMLIRYLAIDGTGLSSGNRKAAVIPWQEAGQHGIGVVQILDSL